MKHPDQPQAAGHHAAGGAGELGGPGVGAGGGVVL
jgi:hypothetical protein